MLTAAAYAVALGLALWKRSSRPRTARPTSGIGSCLGFGGLVLGLISLIPLEAFLNGE